MSIDIKKVEAQLKAKVAAAEAELNEFYEFVKKLSKYGEKEEPSATPVKRGRKVLAKAKITTRVKTTAQVKTKPDPERPGLKSAIVQVMGKKTLSAAQIVQALEEKKWLPSSSNPQQYISYMLSSNTPDVFERTDKRGFYRVKNGTPEKVEKKRGRPKKSEVDAKLASLGVNIPTLPDNVSSDPFKEAGIDEE